SRMNRLSTNQVARKLGIGIATLTRHIQASKVPAPPETMAGGMRMRLWSESDIERLKEALPKIANGRKTRYKKKQSATSSQQSAKTKAQPKSAVPRQKKSK